MHGDDREDGDEDVDGLRLLLASHWQLAKRA
jgi:hypothetical protein